MHNIGTLYFLCGKMGSGKTTQSHLIVKQHNAIRLSEDEWLAALYPQQINSFDDYLRFSSQIKPLFKAHIQAMLCAGANVVLDFPANTLHQRQWFKSIYTEVGAPHVLVYLAVDDITCLKQIARRRREQPEREKFDTEAMFYHVSQFFEAPYDEEGFNIQQLTSVQKEYS